GNTGGNFTNEYSAYVDWNQDGDFDDEGEAYWMGRLVNSTGRDGKQTYESISVPADAVPGPTRLRIVKSYNEVGEACGGLAYGQAEDYSVLVSGGPAPSDTQPLLLLPIVSQA